MEPQQPALVTSVIPSNGSFHPIETMECFDGYFVAQLGVSFGDQTWRRELPKCSMGKSCVIQTRARFDYTNIEF